MKKFAAHFVFPGNSAPVPGGIVETDADGTVLRLIQPRNDLRELAGMEFHNGILCPAFVSLPDPFSPDLFFSYFPGLKVFESFLPDRPTDERRILEWMKAIQLTTGSLSLEQLIRQFAYEPARVSGRLNERGSLEPGKRPGLILIDHIDYPNLQLTENSRLKRLI